MPYRFSKRKVNKGSTSWQEVKYCLATLLKCKLVRIALVQRRIPVEEACYVCTQPPSNSSSILSVGVTNLLGGCLSLSNMWLLGWLTLLGSYFLTCYEQLSRCWFMFTSKWRSTPVVHMVKWTNGRCDIFVIKKPTSWSSHPSRVGASATLEA